MGQNTTQMRGLIFQVSLQAVRDGSLNLSRLSEKLSPHFAFEPLEKNPKLLVDLTGMSWILR